MSTKIPAVFGSLVFILMVAVIWRSVEIGTASLLEVAEFAVLALTLIVLGIYAHDKNSIARVTRKSWERQSVLSTTYSMDVVPQDKRIRELRDKSAIGRRKA